MLMNRLHSYFQYVAALFIIAALGACATHIPEQIRATPKENILPRQVQKAPQVFLGKTIRWGGTVIAIKNHKNETRLTILSQMLNRFGQPAGGDQSNGRFIAVVPQFLDPAIYAKQRNITVVGTVNKVETKKIDDFAYDYPIIKVTSHYLWPPEREIDDDFYPWFWHDPWYPYYHPHSHR